MTCTFVVTNFAYIAVFPCIGKIKAVFTTEVAAN
jgi:hypothetical protein